MMISFRLNKVRAHRVLVVIRPAGTGWLHRLRSQRSGDREAKRICPARNARSGKLFSPDGCSHEARGAAAPPPGFTTTQGRLGPNRSERRYGHSASPHEGFSGTPLTRQGRSQRQAERPRPCGAMLERGVELHSKAGRRP
jgi:hypothetical protein